MHFSHDWHILPSVELKVNTRREKKCLDEMKFNKKKNVNEWREKRQFNGQKVH